MTALGPYFLNNTYYGDAMHRASLLPCECVDLIFTDPPYDKKSLPLYWYVAWIANRVLKPNGFVLAMGGGMYADQILAHLTEYGLNYQYTLHVTMTDQQGCKLRPNGQRTPIISRVKPIYVVSKGEKAKPRTVVYSPFAGDGNDKRFHHWGQDMKSARYYIDCFSRPGDVVLDPFMGGGTTAVVSQALGRYFLGFDTDLDAVATARARVRNPEFYTPSANGQQVLEFAK